MLRDREPLEEWARRDDPPVSVWRAVVAWVEGLDQVPWQAPSRPEPDMSNQPEYEVRSAVVPGTGGIEVYYRQIYAEDVVDLIAVASPLAGSPDQ